VTGTAAIAAVATSQEGERGDGEMAKRFEDETPVQRVLDVAASTFSQVLAGRRDECDSLGKTPRMMELRCQRGCTAVLSGQLSTGRGVSCVVGDLSR
jgi:hypothetical protein